MVQRTIETIERYLNDLSDGCACRMANLAVDSQLVRALAESGRTAGIDLSVRDGRVVFIHRWRFLKAAKPVS
jgi:hypothetical protein